MKKSFRSIMLFAVTAMLFSGCDLLNTPTDPEVPGEDPSDDVEEYLSLSRNLLITLDEARSYTVGVEAGVAWTATKSDGADWLTITEAGEAEIGRAHV